MMRLSTRTLPGVLSVHNSGTVSWGHHGLLAYGANHVVAVVDGATLQHACSLHAHRSTVTKLSWAPAPILSDCGPQPIYLATGDTSGCVALHDVIKGVTQQKLNEAHKVVNELELFYVGTELFLLALYQPATLVLWSPISGDLVWKKSFSEPLYSFTRNPFDSQHIVFQGGSFVQLVKDFSTTGPPTDGTRFNMSANIGPGGSSSTEKARTPDGSKKGNLTVSDSRGSRLSEEDTPLTNHIQVMYHQTIRNCLVLVYPQDIMILDLDIKQTVGIISLERTTCPFVQVYPCRTRDAMYCLHDNGTIVIRTRRFNTSIQSGEGSSTLSKYPSDVTYEAQCSSDGVRITKQQRMFGFTICPISETKAVEITSEGKLLLWELQQKFSIPKAMPPTPQCPIVCLPDVFTPSTSGQMIHDDAKYNFLLTGVATSLPAAPFVVRMCPALTTKNFHMYQPLLAVGSMQGVIQIVNLTSGQIERDFSVHSCQVRGIEWASLHSIISHAYDSKSSTHKSELAFTNIRTGKVSQFRQSKADEGVVQAVRISYLKQYMVIVFKNKPFELWELKTLTMLREMPSDFPTVTALQWSPAPFKKKLGDDKAEGEKSPSYMVREHFVFTDNTNLLYHYIVEGSMIKDGSKIAAEGVNGAVTAMAWRHELLVLGDSNGNVSFWDLKAKKSKDFASHKGMVRRVRFAPGKENTLILILFNEEVQIWDKVQREMVSSLKFPKEIGRVSDADWASSDRLALSIADGYIVITDISLHKYTSPLASLNLKGGSCYLDHDCKALWALRYQMSIPVMDQRSLPDTIKLSNEMRRYVESCTSIPERNLLAAHYVGDRFAIQFWTLCQHYLRPKKIELVTHNDSSETELDTEKSDNSQLNSGKPLKQHLESCYDVLCSNSTFKASELTRVNLHDNKRFSGDIRLKSASRYILMGETDHAVHLLLESEAGGPSFFSDSLRACLLATVRSSGSSQSTIKLVATNLIANGKLSEGVELLCLIDKGMDACRYLQTYGQWYEASWLAKVALNDEESPEVISRWLNEHLCSPSINAKPKAVLAAVSIGDYMKAVELLYSMQCYSIAAMFIESCLHMNLLAKNSKNLPVMEAVFYQYARALKDTDMIEEAIKYCEKAGEQADHLSKELQQQVLSKTDE